MKKINMLVLLVVLCSAAAFAQAPLGKGGRQLNAGLGFSNWGVPVYVGIDFGVHQDITVGPVMSFGNHGYSYSGGKYNQNYIMLGFNGNYHFNTLLDMPSQWDFYAGLTLGYYFFSNENEPNANSDKLDWRGQVGGRYFFSDNFGINIEFGGGTSSGGGIGITYKF